MLHADTVAYGADVAPAPPEARNGGLSEDPRHDYDPRMATVDLLHAGYIRDEGTRVGSSITLVRDGDARSSPTPGSSPGGR